MTSEPTSRTAAARRSGRALAGALLVVVVAVLALPVGSASAAPPRPAVGSVTPDRGTAAGGDVVTLRGTTLGLVTGILLWGQASEYPVADFVAVSDTEIRITTAPMSAGPKTIILTFDGSPSLVTTAEFASQGITAFTPVRAVAIADVAPNVAQCVQVRGRYGVPLTAGGVFLNVTTTAPAGLGHVVVYPDIYENGQTPPPLASTVNFIPGQDVANAAVVQLYGIGRVCFLTRGARTGILLDVEGFQASEGGPFQLGTAERYVDTRSGSRIGQIEGPILPRTIYNAYAGPPPGPIGGLVLANITVSGASAPGNLSVFAAGSRLPTISTVNYLPGADRANLALVGTSQEVFSLYSETAPDRGVQVMIDNLGFTLTWPGSLSFPPTTVQPSGTRVVDTRTSTRTGPFSGPLQAGTVYRLPVSVLADRPAGAHTAILNVIAVGPTSTGHLRVFADAGPTLPDASVLNFLPGADTSNLVFADLDTGGYVDFYSGQPTGQSTNLVVDVVAYSG